MLYPWDNKAVKTRLWYETIPVYNIGNLWHIIMAHSSQRNSAADCSKIIQIPWLGMTSHLWLNT